jgi:hypothetical protein
VVLSVPAPWAVVFTAEPSGLRAQGAGPAGPNDQCTCLVTQMREALRRSFERLRENPPGGGLKGCIAFGQYARCAPGRRVRRARTLGHSNDVTCIA